MRFFFFMRDFLTLRCKDYKEKTRLSSFSSFSSAAFSSLLPTNEIVPFFGIRVRGGQEISSKLLFFLVFFFKILKRPKIW